MTLRPGTGLSPRVRGNPPPGRGRRWPSRSIPACAGEPASWPGATVAFPVYPRVCGGTSSPARWSPGASGLSPRVRGNLLPGRDYLRQSGSIPACAGEPSAASSRWSRVRVYPRVCGGTSGLGDWRIVDEGLSPRVRGNHLQPHALDICNGSIPACAGEPARAAPGGRGHGVYPRVCGGTRGAGEGGRGVRGLSPRVRGNPGGQGLLRLSGGSIPACAGEPRRSGRCTRPRWVYPRVCGGTMASCFGMLLISGLSPRVRGNLHPPREQGAGSGSIPACAGEPSSSAAAWWPPRVYPRVCGGTRGPGSREGRGEGLSPRVRGNRGDLLVGEVRLGSIPACAGEPGARSSMRVRTRVYPRVCGGTRSASEACKANWGLSPRVRGNPRHRDGHAIIPGSIPACAGEPRARHRSKWRARVYPRVCGGTMTLRDSTYTSWGLSPRVRGNPIRVQIQRVRAGSIPACAGEPRAWIVASFASRVYPRVCGGTFLAH